MCKKKKRAIFPDIFLKNRFLQDNKLPPMETMFTL